MSEETKQWTPCWGYHVAGMCQRGQEWSPWDTAVAHPRATEVDNPPLLAQSGIETIRREIAKSMGVDPIYVVVTFFALIWMEVRP